MATLQSQKDCDITAREELRKEKENVQQ